MTTTLSSAPNGVLRTAMRANGMFSILSGLTLLAAARPLADLFSLRPSVILVITGALVLIFGIDLLWLTSRPTLAAGWGMIAVALDLLWVAGSAVLLLAMPVPLTTVGIWAIVLVADVVAVFAIWQGYGVWRARQT